MDLGGGVITPGHKPFAVCQTEADIVFERVDLRNRTVLDVGAWTGHFSFEAARRGAQRVLATDSYCWDQFDGRAAFDLARESLASPVEAREIDATDLSPDTVGTFNIVLFLGVFYHLYDPIAVLSNLARVTTDVLIVETHLELRDLAVPAMRFFPTTELGGDPTNWWGPNEHLIEALLRGHGFTTLEAARSPDHNRGIFFAWRSTAGRIRPLAEKDALAPFRAPVWRKAVREWRRLFRQA